MSASVAQRRKQRAMSARVLLSLHESGCLATPERWNWQTLDRLPRWCLLPEAERFALQLTCGALFLSPELRYWIHRSALVELQTLLTEPVWQAVANKADQLQMPREPIAQLMADEDIIEQQIDPDALTSIILRAGASVLQGSIHESLPGDMLSASLGTGLCDLDREVAEAVLLTADSLQLEGDPENVMSSSSNRSGLGDTPAGSADLASWPLHQDAAGTSA